MSRIARLTAPVAATWGQFMFVLYFVILAIAFFGMIVLAIVRRPVLVALILISIILVLAACGHVVAVLR